MADLETPVTFDKVLDTSRTVITNLEALQQQLVEIGTTELGPDDRLVLSALQRCIVSRAHSLPGFEIPPEAADATISLAVASTNGHGKVALDTLVERPPVLPAIPPVLEAPAVVDNPAPNDEPIVSNGISPEQEKLEINGRAIIRVDDETLARFNESRKPVCQQDHVVQIVIPHDKAIKIANGQIQELRTLKDGSPSLIIRVLNIVLQGAIEGIGNFTTNDILSILNDENVVRFSVWQAVERLVKRGVFEKYGSRDRATLVGLPKFVELIDKRPALESSQEETTGFLAQSHRS